jgi:DNA sulfur modification protein DndD
MIQLRSATFKNFRSLRDVSIDFAYEKPKVLTVIRAENAVGKTTLLTALTWALFGDAALPKRRPEYRLHPLHLSAEEVVGRCEIAVEVKFATIDEETGEVAEFNLIRTTADVLVEEGTWQPQPSSLVVLRLTSKGSREIENPTAMIDTLMPMSLKDVFFIDGDRALAFIESIGERTAKRKRVEDAVRQLLGLDLLEGAQKHVDEARLEAMRAVKREAQGSNLASLAEKEEQLTADIATETERLTSLTDDLTATDGRLTRAREAREKILLEGGGDRQQLAKALRKAEDDLSNERKNSESLVKALRSYLNSSSLTFALAGSAIETAASVLRDLEDQKVIPNTLPEIVQERIERGVCICGASVTPGTPGHEVLCGLLNDASKLGKHNEILMHLNAAANRRVLGLDGKTNWVNAMKESERSLQSSLGTIRTLEDRVGELEAQIRGIPEKDIEAADRLVRSEEGEQTRLNSEIGKLRGRIEVFRQQLDDVAKSRSKELNRESKFIRRAAEETAANDLLGVIKGTIAALQGETLVEVSQKMNEIFMQMIVAEIDSLRGAIRSVELTASYDIVVHGPGNSSLDPDIDLSGAQRRALTLAFILSLISVSGVKAPNVVDTPLGMTSGAVKRAILRYAAENSPQLILFLTHDEIRGIEEVLDEFVGVSVTFTHSDHFPLKIKNKPPTDISETLVCRCDHRSWCQLCELAKAN